MRVVEKAYAKINLALQVNKKRSDGFHDLEMIMVPLDLHDTLTLEISQKDEVIGNTKIQDNIILKALNLFKAEYEINECVQIKLEKRIPIGAGLGGGSADAAATIRGLNKLFGLYKTPEELENLVLRLGSDTLFCLYNEPAYVFGRGEYLEFIDYPELKEIILFSPNIEVETKVVFNNYHIKEVTKDFRALLENYKYDMHSFLQNTYNDLLCTALKEYPKLKALYDALKLYHSDIYMTGSGSTFYMIGDNFNNEINQIPGIKVIKTFIKQKNAYK